MTYNAYDRFLEAVKKLPRWSNARRRPIDSNAGKIIRSVIEEIAAVEDAILEYKRQFFLNYYLDKPDTILDYIYYAQVGDIEDLSVFTVLDPACEVTEEESDFYNDRALALYKDGYLFLYTTNETNKLQYSYNGVTYKSDIKEQAVWNIFDEYAWWFGLERFTGERNASLLQRCLDQFKHRPNSTEQGIKNAIVNAAQAKVDLLDTDRTSVVPLVEEDVQFLEPNEETLSKINKDGITLYEEISQFNRDIARTRKWDMDYWDNAFRELKYLPHKWDADVNIYRDGVGYHDALKVTNLKNVGQESTTDVEIYGFVRSADEIDTYLREKNIQQNIGLTLTKYDNLINPIPVSCRIEAEDMVPIEHPEQIKLVFYKEIREGTYDLDDFVINSNDAVITSNAALQPNTNYKIAFVPKDTSGKALSVSKCDLLTNGVAESKLEEQNNFKFRGSGIVDTNILFHGDKIADFLEPANLKNAVGEGFTLASPLDSGSFSINLQDWAGKSLELNVDPDSGWQDITSSLVYIKPDRFTYDSSKNQYISSRGSYTGDKLVLTFEPHMCRNLEFYLDTDEVTDDEIQASVTFAIQDGDTVRTIDSRPRIRVNGGTTVTFNNETELDTNRKLIVTIARRDICPHRIIVGRIRRRSYWFEFNIKHGDDAVQHRLNSSKILSLPTNLPEGSVLYCTVHSGQNPVPPIIKYVHIGPKPSGRNNYTLLISTGNTGPYALDIKTNYDIVLTNRDTGEVTEHYTTRKTYSGNADLYLDLSAFETVYKTSPAVKKRNELGSDIYVLSIDSPIAEIYIEGTGYQENKAVEMTLADLAALNANETLYAAKSYPGFIKIWQAESGQDQTCELVTFPRNSLPDSDRIKIVTDNIVLQACFKANGVQHLTNVFDGGFDSFYLYNTTAQQYLAYHTIPVIQFHTETQIIPVFSPVPKDMARLVYKISEPWPAPATHLYYGQMVQEDWTAFKDEPICIDIWGLTAEIIANNVSTFEAKTTYEGKKCQLGNTIALSDIIQDNTILSHIGEYNITPPDKMEIVYQDRTYTQEVYEDGSALYVEEDSFNKLKHANITKINKIRIDGITYSTQSDIQTILELMPEPGIICWINNAPIGGWIEWIQYSYKEPVSLRYKNIEDLYTIARYPVDVDRNINDREYVIENVTDGQEIQIDASYFKVTPDKIIAVCSNPCFYGTGIPYRRR